MSPVPFFSKQTSLKNWAHALSHDVHIINRLPTKLLKNYSPYFNLFNTHPNYSSMKVFDCLDFACSSKRNRTKLDFRSRKCIYLGIEIGVKGSILQDIHNKNLFISRDIIFFEFIFPYTKISQSPNHKS